MAINKDDEKKVVNQNNEKPYGVSDSAWEGTKETFSVSDNTNDAKSNMDNASNKYTSHTQKDMISSSTQKAMNQSFKVPTAVKEADAWISKQLELIQSGKTSYSDQVKDMMDKIMNREKFSYDVDNDQLFQQALSSAMNSGKTAMQDTIGQASALTGGYGSTYATTAGNQAYNAFIEDAYKNLPQYYQMAMEAYQMEGDEMYRQFGMVSELDDKEFNRNIAAYDATYQHRNQMYNEAYTQYRDEKSDAFAMAGIEMQEYSQKSNDLYNLYNIASNTYESMYKKEYDSWSDRVNNAWKTVEVENSDAWANKNFDESVRQYEKNYLQNEEHFNKQLAQNDAHHKDQMSYNWASLNSRNSGGGGETLKLTDTEIKEGKKILENGGSMDEVLEYLAAKGKFPETTDDYAILDSALGIDNANSNNSGKQNKFKTGTISGFKTKTGDNFDVKVGSTSYRVENKGKVDDNDTIEKLNKASGGNKTAFLYNGDAYVSYGGGYYKLGATNILWGETGGYQKLLKAMQK